MGTKQEGVRGGVDSSGEEKDGQGTGEESDEDGGGEKKVGAGVGNETGGDGARRKRKEDRSRARAAGGGGEGNKEEDVDSDGVDEYSEDVEGNSEDADEDTEDVDEDSEEEDEDSEEEGVLNIRKDPLTLLDENDDISPEDEAVGMTIPDGFRLQESRPAALDGSLVKRGVLLGLSMGWFGG